MGNRFVDNVVILSTVLLRITNVYNILFDNGNNAVQEAPTQWWSVVGDFFVDNALFTEFLR